MAISLGELRAVLSLQDNFSKPINEAAKGVGVFSQSMGAITGLVGTAATAIGAATAAVVGLGVHGSAVNDVKDAFAQLSAQAGSSANVMLGELKAGTDSTVTNFELMKMANAALGNGLVASAADMGTLAAGAKLLADRTGGDTAQAFDTLTGAMASGRTASLKQLGLFVDSKTAVEAYARSVGKSVSDLNDHERATALSQGALKALRTELDAAGAGGRDFADNIDRAKVFVQNFVDDLSSAVAASPVIQAAFDHIGVALEKAFGADTTAMVDAVAKGVDRFAIFLVDVAEVAVEAARFVVNGWSGLKVMFNGLMEALSAGAGLAARGLLELAEAGKDLPLIGDAFEAAIPMLRDVANMADGARASFKQQSDDAITGAASQNAAFDSVQESLTEMRAGMEAAALTTGTMTEASTAAADGVRRVGEAATMSAAEIKAMEDATRAGQEALFDMAAQGAEKMRALQEEISLANMTGLERRLADIEIARTQEIAGLQHLAFSYPEMYEQIVALVNEKYGQMTGAAQGHFSSVQQAAAAAGFSTRSELEHAAGVAKTTYDAMKASGLFTYSELQKAHKAWKDAEEKLDTKSMEGKVKGFVVVAESASSILKSLFGKNKAAAIAAAIIDTAAAIAKALSAYPWPLNLAPAAAAAAAGWAQVNAIRSTDAGFRFGTPGMAFEDFGRGTAAVLHNEEAVVTRGQGEGLADMVGGAIREAMATASGGLQRITIPVSIGGHVLDEVIMQRTRAGWIQVGT